MFAALGSLDYLVMSGRVTNLTASMALLLDIKPVLTMRDGTLDLLERVRTQKKAWSRVIELAADAAGGRPPDSLAIVHSDAPSAARRFEGLFRERIVCPDEIIFAPLTPGLSVVSGPGLVGVVLVTQA